MMMRRWYILLGVGVLVGLLAVAAAVMARPYTLHGSVIDGDYPAPDFSLPDGRGGQFTLSEQRGSLTLIFFGYTACPDVCPTTLSAMKQASRALGKDAEKLRVVFITVDPQRDTPESAAAYAASFNPTFYGLSGSEGQLAPVWKDYGVFRALNRASPTDTVYTVDHSSQVYLVDQQGSLRLTYAFGTPVQDILADLRYLLRKG
jgi:protein SCO1/2